MTDALFDLEGGRADRDEGIARILSRPATDWTRNAKGVIQAFANAGVDFTADDVIEVVGLPPTGSRNIVGALFNAARAEGAIERVGEAKAQRRARHAGRVSLWRGVGHAT